LPATRRRDDGADQRSKIMTISDIANPSDLFLRRALMADAAVSGATGVLTALGSGLLADLLGLPPALMLYAGLSLLPFAAIVALLAARRQLPRAAVWAVIAYNALWTIDSLALLMSGWIAPTILGEVFVAGQALVVAAFAGLQRVGLRRAGAAIA
jgi:hypothetical protein